MLKEYTKIHFKTEEDLLIKAEYPDLKEHLKLHVALVEKTEKISVNAVSNDDADLILQFLKKWWLEHINIEDKKYEPFVRKLL